jgi:cholesterol transport system auxiliary component
MNAICRVLAGCTALTLTACSIGRPIPPAKTYIVEPSVPKSESFEARSPDSLRIGHVRVAAAYAGNALIYRVDDVRFVSDPYNQFMAEPGAMIANQMAAWLDRTGPFRTVAQPESTRAAHYVLEATITELYGDFRPGVTPAAVLAVQFALIDQASVRPKSVLERVVAKRVDLPRAAPDALVRGYGEALGAILGELRDDLQGAAVAKESR